MRVAIKDYTDVVNKEGSILGETLETALEYGENFGELVTKCKAVSFSVSSIHTDILPGWCVFMSNHSFCSVYIDT